MCSGIHRLDICVLTLLVSRSGKGKIKGRSFDAQHKHFIRGLCPVAEARVIMCDWSCLYHSWEQPFLYLILSVPSQFPY